MLFILYFRNSCQPKVIRIFPPMFSSRSFVVLAITGRSVILSSFCVWCEVGVLVLQSTLLIVGWFGQYLNLTMSLPCLNCLLEGKPTFLSQLCRCLGSQLTLADPSSPYLLIPRAPKAISPTSNVSLLLLGVLHTLFLLPGSTPVPYPLTPDPLSP